MELWLSKDPDGRTVLHASGEIDIEVAEQLRDAGLQAASVNLEGPVLDLSQVTFMDSSGISALVSLNNEMHPSGRRLTLLSPSQPVRSVLEITGLTPAFDIREEP